MPRSQLMSWEPKPRRWKKIYKGKAYTISCTQLGVDETKEASYKAANEWWTKKRVELDQDLPPREDYGGALDMLELRRDWCRKNGREDEASAWQARIDELSKQPFTPEADPFKLVLPLDFERRKQAIEAYGGAISADIDGLSAEFQYGDGRLWDDRQKVELKSTSMGQPVRTTGRQVADYLGFQLARHRSGQISVSDYDQTRQYLTAFQEWIGPQTSIDGIDSARWEAWYVHLLGCGKSLDTKKKRFRRARDFVAWLGERSLITVPGNLLARRHRFKSEDNEIRLMSRSEVQTLIEAAPGQLKLHLLLMLNCGFTQQDVADLGQEEVDWLAGMISRRRSKTGDTSPSPWSLTACGPRPSSYSGGSGRATPPLP